MKSIDYLGLLVIFVLVTVLTFHSQYGGDGTTEMLGINIFYKPVPSRTVHPMSPGSKWIVVTSVQYPTEDVKNLANQQGWNLVVVADTKTPSDWKYSGVHFLSIQKQKELFGDFAEKLPYKSYTRKNLGYLYAIMKGAEWIYDTDDDNKPYGLGLAQFDYNLTVTGLRYISKSGNISEKLFNPYRFYGFDNMWPRGFPLEYIEGHTNGKDRMVSCREMLRPAVQQGIVKTDPDVDAIYRLLYSEKDTGLNVSFNSIAPPIILDTGTYAPWNSQNTLFHYKAFFIMYLPTTVAFRVTDIWRSYFGQKLLHLIGENVAFYPTNAVQIRNAHDYLADFHQEIDVYEQSGKIVEFLDKWICSYSDIVNCALQLADGFVENNFFGTEDRKLIEAWFQQLTQLGYNFPSLPTATGPIPLGGKFSNCRGANLDLGTDSYRSEKDTDHSWATETLNGFGEILEWCAAATDENDTLLPTVEEFLHYYKNHTGLQQKKDTVLVLISNFKWRSTSYGLLQRLYSPFFKATVFCGTWTDPSEGDPDLLPPIEPLNFVNITPKEMRKGQSYSYCVPKVNDLRLQNVTGYYFVADDTVFNIWSDLPLDKYLNPNAPRNNTDHWNLGRIKKSYEAFENHYKNGTKFGISWREHKNKIQNMFPGSNFTEHYFKTPYKAIGDFFYVPSHSMEYIGNLLEIMAEAEIYVEVAMGKIADGLDYTEGPFNYLWYDGKRGRYEQYYNNSLIGIHPVKPGKLHTDLGQRKKYCNSIVKTFAEEIYGLRK